jgi:hypothetical protein
MQSFFYGEVHWFFISKSVFQCELHLFFFLTRIIALYQNLKQSIFYRVGIP